MTMSVVRGRAENANDPQALAYYDRIERESKQIFHASPYKQGANPPKFHFDLSYNYYPTAFYRPGPDVRIYRLSRCGQRTGPLAKSARFLYVRASYARPSSRTKSCASVATTSRTRKSSATKCRRSRFSS